MPSPFPGMDPYLESSAWASFHGQFVAELARQLAPKLRPKYLALMGEREAISVAPPLGSDDDGDGDVMYPDVAVAEAASDVGGAGAGGGGAATLVAPVQVRTVVGEPVPEWVLEIRDAERRRLVTLIEVLSPSNKRGDDYAAYVNKRNHALVSPAHLVEIDLLRGGKRVPMLDPLPPAPYFVFVSRSRRRPETGVWPVALASRLPEVPIPLLSPDPDARLDLQQAFTNVYDGLGYDLILRQRYAGHLPANWPEPDLVWIRQTLAEAGVSGAASSG